MLNPARKTLSALSGPARGAAIKFSTPKRGDTVKSRHCSRLQMLIVGLMAAIAMTALQAQADWPDEMPGDAEGMKAYLETRYDMLDAELEAAIEVANREGKLDIFELDAALHYSMSSESSDRTYARVNQGLREAAGSDEIDSETVQQLEELAAERKAAHEEIGNELVATLMNKMAETGAGDNQQAQAWLAVFALFAVDFSEAMGAMSTDAVRGAVDGIRQDLPSQILSAATSAPDKETRENAFLEVMQSSAEASDTACQRPAERTVPGGREDTDHLRGMMAEHCQIIIAGVAVGEMPEAMLTLYQAAGWDETMAPVMDDLVSRTRDD